MTDDLGVLDATALAELVRDGSVSPRELVDAALARIDAVNPSLNAVIHRLDERARAEAEAAPDGPFRGVPILVKDLDGSLGGEPLHLGNRLLRDLGYTADHDSYLFAKLRAAGCIIVGKTNTPELGLLPTTESHAYGAAHNPWDLTRSPGGSSGGSAAAVASGVVPFAHAGDGGGSIRIPASACGLFGLKPTRGRVSLGPDDGEAWAGLVARHVVTRSVRDSAAVLDVISTPVLGDPYSAAPPARPYVHDVGIDPGALRIGSLLVNSPAGLVEVDPVCMDAAKDAKVLLEQVCGHTVESGYPEALDDIALLVHFTTVLAASTAYDVHKLAAMAGRALGPEDVEPFTWAQAELGRAVTAEAYIDAVESLRAWSRRIVRWWEPDGGGFDLLLTPTMAKPPAPLGEIRGDDPEGALLNATPYAAFTVPFNVTGQPAMSVPLHWADGLPIGVQLVAAPGREDVLFRVAAQLEAARPWIDRRPPVHG
ncbi:MAG: amidase [Actinomycetota bacterium]|nr:amidase [Actinomycetota bacterium]